MFGGVGGFTYGFAQRKADILSSNGRKGAVGDGQVTILSRGGLSGGQRRGTPTRFLWLVNRVSNFFFLHSNNKSAHC